MGPLAGLATRNVPVRNKKAWHVGWPAALPAGLLGLRRNSLRRRGGPARPCRCCWGVLCGAAKDRGAACRWHRPALLGGKRFSAPEPRGRLQLSQPRSGLFANTS